MTTSLTKFHHCLAALPQDVATRLIYLVCNPAADLYATLRACLVQMYTLSNFQRYKALQSIPVSMDRKPSELMCKILVLLPENEKSGFFFLGLFMACIPADICSHLQTESVAVIDNWLPEQTSSGQYKKELTLYMLSLLGISGMLKVYLLCP